MSAQSKTDPNMNDFELIQLAQATLPENLNSELAQPPAEEPPPALLSFDPGVAIWTLVVFVMLLVLLRKMAWGPIISSINERDRTIKESLEKAGEVQAESKRLAEEQGKILAEARAEANGILQQTRQAADEMKQKIERVAHEEKERILQSAQKEIDSAKIAALSELRKTTADLSIQIAEKLIRKSLDDAAHRKLVDTLIEEMSERA